MRRIGHEGHANSAITVPGAPEDIDKPTAGNLAPEDSAVSEFVLGFRDVEFFPRHCRAYVH